MARKSRIVKRLTGQELIERKQHRLREQDDEEDMEFDEEGELWIEIDGERIEVDDVMDGGYLPTISGDGMEFNVAEDSDAAIEAAKEYWRDMDDDEIVSLLGAEKIMGYWVRGQSFEDFLDEYMRYDGPEFEWAGYDHTERLVDATSPALIEELGFEPGVAYRHN